MLPACAAASKARTRNSARPSSAKTRSAANKTLGRPSERRGIQAEGDPIISTRLGSNNLSIQRYRNGERRATSTVSAKINDQRVERVYREMLFLLGKSVDETSIGSARRMVNMHIDDMPLAEALTKLLRQVDLAWKSRGNNDIDSDSQIIIYEANDENFTADPKRVEAEALAALRQASTGPMTPSPPKRVTSWRNTMPNARKANARKTRAAMIPPGAPCTSAPSAATPISFRNSTPVRAARPSPCLG